MRSSPGHPPSTAPGRQAGRLKLNSKGSLIVRGLRTDASDYPPLTAVHSHFSVVSGGAHQESAGRAFGSSPSRLHLPCLHGHLAGTLPRPAVGLERSGGADHAIMPGLPHVVDRIPSRSMSLVIATVSAGI